MNLFRLRLTPDGVGLGGLNVPLPRSVLRATAAEGAAEIVLGVRPEQFDVLPPQDLVTPGLDLVVEAVEDTGAVVHLHTSAPSAARLGHIVVRLPGRPTHSRGEPVRVAVRTDAVHCFSAATGMRYAYP
jgi:multiple sugar transport system ATP-binding protein